MSINQSLQIACGTSLFMAAIGGTAQAAGGLIALESALIAHPLAQSVAMANVSSTLSGSASTIALTQASAFQATALQAATQTVAAQTAAAQAAAQPAPSPGDAPVIRAIAVRGNQRIESQTIGSYLVFQEGDRADPKLLDVGLKTLFNTGLFSDVKLEMAPDGTLVIDVAENPIVNRVILEGNKRVKDDKITEEVRLAPRSIFTRAKAQADVQRIIEVYRATGRFAATVTPKVKPLDQNRVDVIYEIDEGPKTGVAKVNFIGNEAFTANELRGILLTKESRWWRFFSSNSNYDPDRLEFERDLLRQHYAKNGYADFQVVSAVAELTPDRKDFFITFTVDEGEKYEIGDVRVKTTLDRLDEKALERFVPIRTGQTFNGERVESTVESIVGATGSLGYAFVDVQPRLERNADAKTIDLTFQVNEGPRVYVERININGNTRTLDRVIRRELRLAEGDAYNKVAVDRSEIFLDALQYFSDVTIEEKPGSSIDRTELDVNVEEQSTGAFSVGVGVSSTDNFIVDVSVEQRNLLGRGQTLVVRSQISQRTRLVDLRFQEPRFLDRNLAAGISAFNSRTDFREVGIIRNRIGFGLNAGFQVSEFGRGSLQYQFSRDQVGFDQESTQVLADPQGFIDNALSPNQTSAVINPQAMAFGVIPGVDGGNAQVVDTFGFVGPNGEIIFGNSASPAASTSFFTGPSQFAPGGSLVQQDENGNIIVSPAQTDDDGNVIAPAVTLDPATLSPIQSVTFQTCDLLNNSFTPQCTSRGRFFTSLIGYSLGFSTQDSVRDPTRGFNLQIAQSFAGVGGDVNFVRTVGSAAYYKRLYKGFIGKLQLRAGYIEGYNGDTVRLQDRFFEGAGTFRGFDVAGIGPRFLSGQGLDREGRLFGQALGAKLHAIGTAEIRVPLPLPPEYGIRAALFTDFGTVGLVDDQDKLINENENFFVNPVNGQLCSVSPAPNCIAPVQDDLSLRASAGVSISWDSPFGPVRFDIAEVFLKEEFDQVQSFRFSAGTSF